MNLSEQTLSKAYKSFFPIGAAIAPRHLRTHADLLLSQYNSITAENCMKFEPIHPEPNRYAFGDADALADFARGNGFKMRGHTLVWHNQTPNWVFENTDGSQVTRETLIERMREHIHTVVGRYRDAIYCWDVVNEAISDEGEEILRRTRWREIIGDDYIQRAFQFAHEADPNATLFYNDYNEANPTKTRKIVSMLKELIEQGAPIHGMGMQAHYGPTKPTVDEIRAALETYAALGIQVQITEMDLSVYEWDDEPNDLRKPTPEMMERQAIRYEQIFALLREFRSVVTGVTLWGLADDSTWLDNFPVRGRKNWPLLFDETHKPKEACRRVMSFQE
jgi:endo-1,4-beta-xylanase